MGATILIFMEVTLWFDCQSHGVFSFFVSHTHSDRGMTSLIFSASYANYPVTLLTVWCVTQLTLIRSYDGVRSGSCGMLSCVRADKSSRSRSSNGCLSHQVIAARFWDNNGLFVSKESQSRWIGHLRFLLREIYFCIEVKIFNTRLLLKSL